MKYYLFLCLLFFVRLSAIAQDSIPWRYIDNKCRCPNFRLGSQGYKVPIAINKSQNLIEFRLYSGGPHFSNLTVLALHEGKITGFFYTRHIETFVGRNLSLNKNNIESAAYKEFELPKEITDSLFSALVQYHAFDTKDKAGSRGNGSWYRMEYKAGARTGTYVFNEPVSGKFTKVQNNNHSLIALFNSHTSRYFQYSLQSK